jgi:DNA-binding transcriptional LysR family regulator
LPGADGSLSELSLTSRLRFDDLEVTADAAVAGMGIAWLPYWLVRDRIRAGALLPLWEERPSFSMDSFAIWPATDHLPLRVRLAIDTVIEKMPEVVGAEVSPVRPDRSTERRASLPVQSRAKRQRAIQKHSST